jgi:hypothetical protein
LPVLTFFQCNVFAGNHATGARSGSPAFIEQFAAQRCAAAATPGAQSYGLATESIRAN